MHKGVMRTHSDIIRTVGPAKIAALVDRPILTVRSWVQRNSLPAENWQALIDAGHCTADELIAAAAAKAEPPAEQAA